MQRTVGGTFQPSNDGEIDSDAGGGASYLGWGSSQGKPLSLIDSWEKRAMFTLTRLHCKTKASLYRGRERSNFIVQAQRCERAGEVLGGRHPNSEDATDDQKEKQVLSRAKQVAR
jgi:hypothetical protein